ncbi:MAG TPA: T9SS type A sorting domain-containing protein, partial [Flavobacteriales bacterium]|nr:T9SS type A sorting domain-containing protein [Flavobacteriales bacterium]
PANDRILLANATVGSTARITDLNGRLALVQRITSPNETLDVHVLQPGAYMLILEGLAPQRFMIVR